MPRFEVTTALTAYTTYTVEAANRNKAEGIVSTSLGRADLPSRPTGYGDDEEVIDVREVSDGS